MKILYVNKLLNAPNAEAGIFPDKKGQSPKHFNKTYIYLISMETKLLQNAFFSPIVHARKQTKYVHWINKSWDFFR